MIPATPHAMGVLAERCASPEQVAFVQALTADRLVQYLLPPGASFDGSSVTQTLTAVVQRGRAGEVAALAGGVDLEHVSRMAATVRSEAGDGVFALSDPSFAYEDLTTALARVMLEWDGLLRTGSDDMVRVISSLAGLTVPLGGPMASTTLADLVTVVAPNAPRDARPMADPQLQSVALGRLSHFAGNLTGYVFTVLQDGPFGSRVAPADQVEEALATLIGDEVDRRGMFVSAHAADSPDLVQVTRYALTRAELIDTARALAATPPAVTVPARSPAPGRRVR